MQNQPATAFKSSCSLMTLGCSIGGSDLLSHLWKCMEQFTSKPYRSISAATSAYCHGCGCSPSLTMRVVYVLHHFTEKDLFPDCRTIHWVNATVDVRILLAFFTVRGFVRLMHEFKRSAMDGYMQWICALNSQTLYIQHINIVPTSAD